MVKRKHHDCSEYILMLRDNILNHESTRNSKSEKIISPPMDLNRSCMKCGEPLTSFDVENLDSYQIKFDYCSAHIPKHFLRKERK
jgi:hypothetical protein